MKRNVFINIYLKFLFFILFVISPNIYCNNIKNKIENPDQTSSDQQRDVLISIYNSSEGENWTRNDNWLSNMPLNDWYGVETSQGNVISIILTNNNLKGIISEQISLLSELNELFLDCNFLNGEIPKELGLLSELVNLSLSDNNLSGTIPEEIFYINRLKLLSLSNNLLNGQLIINNVPQSNLLFLDLSGNMLDGPIPVLNNFSNLTLLNLADNNFDGEFVEAFQSGNQLEYLNLEGNSFSGSIENIWNNMQSLNIIQLQNNLFNNSLPPGSPSFINLFWLDIMDNDFSGEIPEALYKLDSLKYLNISENSFGGEIDLKIGDLLMLEYLSLSENNFTGVVPDSISRLKKLRILEINKNQFYGNLPDGINKIDSLFLISLSDNKMEGLPDLSNCKNLHYLDIYNNHFEFDDIEPIISDNIIFSYSPQAKIGKDEYKQFAEGETINMDIVVGGENNYYKWFKDSVILDGQNSRSLIINNVEFQDAGTYYCEISNSIAKDLILISGSKSISIISGIRENSYNFMFSAYPNPVNNICHIKTSENSSFHTLELINCIAGIVRNVDINGKKEIELNVLGLKSGIYILRLTGNLYSVQKKIMIFEN